MGHEYRIIASLTAKQAEAIGSLLEHSEHFSGKYMYSGKEILEFRHPDNKGEMPDLHIISEADGLYVCQNVSWNLWTHLDFLKQHLEEQQIPYEVSEVD